MSPAETASILRQFNEWRRGDEDIPQFDPREIGEVIDAAVEMIERLEAAEKERDALRAKIAEMERQEPSVSDDWMQHAARMAALARKLREPDWHFESIREMQRELCALEEAALAAAPEAKT